MLEGLDKVPSMNEVIKLAQQRYAEAQAKGDRATMDRAHAIAEQARSVGKSIGMDVRPIDVLGTGSAVKKLGTTSFFDPVKYINTLPNTLPWKPGTQTLQERQMAQDLDITNRQLAQNLKIAQMNEAGATERAKLPWTMGLTPYEQAQIDLSQQKIDNPDMSDSASRSANIGTSMRWIKSKIDEVWADPEKGPQWLVDEGIPWIDGLIEANAGELRGGGLSQNDIIDLKNYARRLISGNIPALGYPDNKAGGSNSSGNDAASTAQEMGLNLASNPNQRSSGTSALSRLVAAVIPGGKATMTSAFGIYRPKYNSNHQGIDFAAPKGTPVMSLANGVVQRVGRDNIYGNYIDVLMPNGLTAKYSHLSAVNVRQGQRVASGQTIGKIGASGRATGPHLDLSIRNSKGQPINPTSLFG